MARLVSVFLLLLLGCDQVSQPPPTPVAAEREVNVLDYRITRRWDLGLEVTVHPAARSLPTPDDLRAINREILRQNPAMDQLTVSYRDQDRELAQYQRSGDQWIWREGMMQRDRP